MVARSPAIAFEAPDRVAAFFIDRSLAMLGVTPESAGRAQAAA
jgi:hypothetical protein